MLIEQRQFVGVRLRAQFAAATLRLVSIVVGVVVTIAIAANKALRTRRRGLVGSAALRVVAAVDEFQRRQIAVNRNCAADARIDARSVQSGDSCSRIAVRRFGGGGRDFVICTRALGQLVFGRLRVFGFCRFKLRAIFKCLKAYNIIF